MMRVLLLSLVVGSPTAVSGASLVLERQCEYLAREHELTLLMFVPSSHEEQRIVRRLRSAGVETVVVGSAVPGWMVGLKRAIQWRAGRWVGSDEHGFPALPSAAMQAALEQRIARRQHDILHVESFGLGGYRWNAALPSVVIEHEVLEDAGTERVARSEQQRAAWRQADRVQVFTQRDADALARLEPTLANAVRVNPFGVDLPQTAGAVEEDSTRVAFVGGFRHAPNVDAALWLATEIMPALRRQSPGVRLSIVGDAPPRAVRELVMSDVEVTGRVPSVEPYVQRAAVVVAPVRLGGGMRVKVLQAMAHGKAVVTTPLGAEGLCGGAAGAPVVLAHNGPEFADAVASLLADSGRRRAVAQRARAFVTRHHSWAAYTDRLVALYEEAVGARRSNNPLRASSQPGLETTP